jgi:hypothetical protein
MFSRSTVMVAQVISQNRNIKFARGPRTVDGEHVPIAGHIALQPMST